MNRLRVSLAGLILLTAALLFGSPAQQCGRCLGVVNAATDSKFEGPTGQALTWRSVQRVHRPATGPFPESRCYERGVTNSSVKAVLDVVWEVASFWKARVPAKSTLCDAISIPGSLARPDPSGPLYYGSARQSLQTQVHAPASSWPNQFRRAHAVEQVIEFSSEMAGRSLSLSSGVGFAQPAHFDAGGTVSVRSEVQFIDSRNFKYTYSVSHDGRDPVQVIWSVVTDREPIFDAHRDYALTTRRSLLVPAGGKILVFTFTSNEPPKWGVGPLIVKDRQGQILAAGSASSYGPRNGTMRDVE
jgi:hypothetical protein